MITLHEAMQEEREKFARRDKLCTKCRWYTSELDTYSSDERNRRCLHPAFFGPIDDQGVAIEYARLESTKCGPSGKLWEPAPKRQSLWGWLRGIGSGGLGI